MAGFSAGACHLLSSLFPVRESLAAVLRQVHVHLPAAPRRLTPFGLGISKTFSLPSGGYPAAQQALEINTPLM